MIGAGVSGGWVGGVLRGRLRAEVVEVVEVGEGRALGVVGHGVVGIAPRLDLDGRGAAGGSAG